MKRYKKVDFSLDEVRRFLEPGPVVLVSSHWKGQSNIMTMGWHMMMGFEPSLVGCYIWDENLSYDFIRRSKECVINVPTLSMAEIVVGIGNCSGKDSLEQGSDKFDEFGLTAVKAKKVRAPLIAECFASFECMLVETKLIKAYNLFIFEVVKAHAPKSPRYPQTIHYRGEGQFMISGDKLNLRRMFKPEML